MEHNKYENPNLQSLYQSFCEKFGEKEFSKACERARERLEEQKAKKVDCKPPVDKK